MERHYIKVYFTKPQTQVMANIHDRSTMKKYKRKIHNYRNKEMSNQGTERQK